MHADHTKRIHFILRLNASHAQWFDPHLRVINNMERIFFFMGFLLGKICIINCFIIILSISVAIDPIHSVCGDEQMHTTTENKIK